MLETTIAALLLYAVAFLTVLLVRARAKRAVQRDDVAFLTGDLLTGAELARQLLDAQDLAVVQVVAADVDAYRAVTRELQLAGERAARPSPAAWAVAAHEVAHAMQHRAGDTTWKRWWVLSGHAVWAGLLLPALLIVQLLVGSPVLAVVALLCALVLATSGLLSWRVERAATATARELLAGSGLPEDGVLAASRLVRRTGQLYVAESVLDTGFVDRVVDPYRGPEIGGGWSGGF